MAGPPITAADVALYGPPPDPRQLLLDLGPAEDPAGWALCLGLGLLLCLLALPRRLPAMARAILFVLGQMVLLTTPLLAHLDSVVLGSFPTIDKEGSLLFYLDGVHERLLLHPLAAQQDPAARLIGVHTGHLWVTALFDLVLSPIGAMNAQALLNMALGWLCAALLLKEAGARGPLALSLGFPFGMGLHVMRDLNWYTIEKSAVFWLALFAWSLLRAFRRGGGWRALPALIYGLMSWMNLYLGLVGAALGGMALVAVLPGCWRRSRASLDLALSVLGCALPGLLLAGWQAWIMQGGPQLGTPEQFLEERAALDGFSLWPLRWNRLEPWRALNPVAFGLVLVGLYRGWKEPLLRFCLGAGLLLFLLSVGPQPWPGSPKNPVYMLAWHLVPGFWRVAKPEVFFEGTFLLLLVGGAVGLKDWRPRIPALVAIHAGVLLCWLLLVRTHPAFPPLAAPVDTTLAPGWEQRVFRGR